MKLIEMKEKVYAKREGSYPKDILICAFVSTTNEKNHNGLEFIFSDGEKLNDYSNFIILNEETGNIFLIHHPYINYNLGFEYLPSEYGFLKFNEEYEGCFNSSKLFNLASGCHYFERDYLPNYSCFVLPKVIKENDAFKNQIINIAKTGKKIVFYLIKLIEKCFILANVSSEEAYSRSDLRSEKKCQSIKDKMTYIDQNIKNFIKNNRIYAGLAYLKDIVLLINYGFSSSNFIKDYLV